MNCSIFINIYCRRRVSGGYSPFSRLIYMTKHINNTSKIESSKIIFIIQIIRCLSEKYLEKHKDIYVAFMDLEKAYDRVDREALWQLFALSLYLSLLKNEIKKLTYK